MNLFFKSKKIYLIFFLILSMEGSALLGNKEDSIHFLNPRILEYNLPNKYLNRPNTSFYKSEKGVIYIGKDNGILVIDGSKSYFNSMEGPVHIASSETGRINYMASSDFGTLEYIPNVGINIISRIHQIPSQHSLFLPYNTVAKDSTIWMSTSEGVFVINNNKYHHFFYNRQECKLIEAESNIFLDVENEGLFIWEDTLFLSVIKPSNIYGERIVSIFESESQFKFLATNGFSFSCDKNFDNISSVKGCCIYGDEIVSMKTMSNDLTIAITKGNKIFIFSEDGNLINALSESDILPSTNIKSVFIDEFNDIWLLYDFDLYKLEYPSNVYSLNLPDAVSGSVLKTLIIGDHIYLGTKKGMQIINTVEKEQWILKTNKQKEDEFINLMDNFEDLVFAAGNKSLYEIIGDKISLISKGNFSCITALDHKLLFVCSDEGLVSYNKDKGNWLSKRIDPSLFNVKNITFFQHRIWILREGKKVSIYNPTSEKYEELDPLSGEADQFIDFDDQLYLTGENNLWIWDEEVFSFLECQDENISKLFINADIIARENDSLWIIDNNDLYNAAVNTYNPESGMESFHLISSLIDLDKITGLNKVGDYLWLTTERQLHRISLDFVPNTSLNTLQIEKVCRLGSDLKSKNIEPEERISFSNDRIIFHLDNLRFQNDPSPYYRYKLTRHQNSWSEWSQENKIQFTGLNEKHYTFKAQSRTITGDISNTVVFKFSVKPPVYRTWYAYLIYSLIFIAAVFLLIKWRLLSYQRVTSRVEAENKDKIEDLLREKEKSDILVSNLLPKGTAEELKAKGRAKSEKYELATVLFSDIQGFTKIAEEMNPEVLIDELDKCFFHFDNVVERYNIEKIKTIGDAYMAAGGIPIKNSTNPIEVVLAGLEMQNFMNELKKNKTDIWDLRIGIHSGPVISGVVGHKKLSYDIWGDTVNTASRMESSGEGGKVNISGITYSMVKDYFICEYRGKLPVKYKGNIDMYFVLGLRPELSVDLHGIPNKRFFLKLQLLRLKDLEDKIFNHLLVEHPGTFHFHSRDHIKHVYNQVELLCRAENISDEDALLTLSASLLLFSGLTESYEHFENKSIVIARKILPEYSYNEKQIDAICNLILATKTPYEPQNKLESILVDAKMEYIGRPDFSRMIKLLFLEMKSNEQGIPLNRLVKMQIELLKNFKFFTIAGQRLREISGEEQISILEAGK